MHNIPESDSTSFKDRISSGLDQAKHKASESGHAAKEKAANLTAKGKDAFRSGTEKSKAMVQQGSDKTKEAASRLKKSGEDQIESNPIAIVAGGLALGAIVAALLPRTERETKYMGSTSKALNDRAKKAVAEAKDVGQSRLEELGIDKEALKAQAKEILSKTGEAAKAAGEAAGNRAIKPPKG